MALPHLVKYIYTHGTDEVIRRGKKIHAIGFVELTEYDELFGTEPFGYGTTVIILIIKYTSITLESLVLHPYVVLVLIIWEIFADTKQQPYFNFRNY